MDSSSSTSYDSGGAVDQGAVAQPVQPVQPVQEVYTTDEGTAMFGMHPEYEGEDVDRAGIAGLHLKPGYENRTAYFDAAQQEAHGTYVDEDGRFRSADGSLLDSASTERIAEKGIGGHLYVRDEDGQQYVADAAADRAALNQDADATGVYQHVHHSSLAGGEDLSGSGEKYYDEGRLTAISDMSGHYYDTQNPLQAAGTMQTLVGDMEAGADLSGTNVHLVEKKYKDAVGISRTLPATDASVEDFMEAGGDQSLLYAMQLSTQEYYEQQAAAAREQQAAEAEQPAEGATEEDQ